MRSRTFREGSVGLLLLLGLGLFGSLILWLNRITPGRSSYKAIVEFANAGGMQKGASVRYRGVKVGTISAINPGPNGVAVEIEIPESDLVIPRDVIVEANQSGLISETVIDIRPKNGLLPGSVASKPLDPDCNPSLIICNGSRLQGQIGISVDELIRYSSRLTALYSDPTLYAKVNQTLENTSIAAQGVAQLTRDLSILSKATQQQLNNFSGAANSIERAANQVSSSTTQLTASTNQTLNKLSTSADQTVNKFGATADELRLTANQANRLLGNLDSLVVNNRSSLVTALNNINETSNQLKTTVGSLSPTVNRFTQGELLQNLEALSANAAQASANLRDVTNTLNNPNNLVVLQQTLDSARVTFENAQKITSDLDELTGDPAFRENLRELVNGLNSLVSSTEQMQEQVEVAQRLDAVKAAVNNPDVVVKTPEAKSNSDIFINTSATAFKKAANKSKDSAHELKITDIPALKFPHLDSPIKTKE